MTILQESVAASVPDPAVPGRPLKRFGHVPALDGLRGAAVLAVLAYHGTLLDRSYLRGGYLGVDLFFVLSGFLITSLLLVEHANEGRIDLVAFWGRRLRRLVPALLVVLVAVGIYAVTVARPVDLGQIRRDGLATLLYVANWGSILGGGSYWDISLAPAPLEHTWSLAIEEQFYLLWPLVVWGLVRASGARGRRRTTEVAHRIQRLAVVGAVLSVWLFVGLYALGTSATRVYEGTDTRAFALLLGCAAGAARYLRLKRDPGAGPSRARWIEVAGLAAVAGLGWAWWSLQGTSPAVYQGLLPVCSVLAAAVIFAAAEPTSMVLSRLFSVAPLRWVGLISYGLYLWHWPVYIVLSPGRTGLSGPALLATRVAVSTAIAAVSYLLVELPIRRRRVTFRRPGTTIAVSFAAVAAVLLVATVGAVDPVQIRDGNVLRTANGTVVGAPKVLFVGDSVGLSLAQPVMAQPKRFRVNPSNEAVIGCSVQGEGRRVRGGAGNILETTPCTGRLPESVASIDPDVVIVSFGSRPTNPIEVDGSFQSACSPAYDGLVERRYRKLLDDLTAGGAVVQLATVARSNGAFAPANEEEAVDCVNEVLTQLAEEDPAVEVLDLDRHVCPGGTCRETVGGAKLRPDGLHFGGPGGETVSKWVVDRARTSLGLGSGGGR